MKKPEPIRVVMTDGETVSYTERKHTMITDIREFCDKHNACTEGRKWALKNCNDMADAWNTAKPDWLIWIATREGVLDKTSLRLFVCWSVRQVWHLLTDERSRTAVDVAERFAKGEATSNELAAARAAAVAAARAAAVDAAVAAWDAAVAAAGDAQASWIRASYPNPFSAQQEKNQ